MRNVIVSGLIFASSFAYASQELGALAPEYQQQREVEVIVSSDEFVAQQEQYGNPTAHIERNQGGYFIETDYYTMQVRIVFEQSSQMGPRPFHIEFDTPLEKGA